MMHNKAHAVLEGNIKSLQIRNHSNKCITLWHHLLCQQKQLRNGGIEILSSVFSKRDK